MKYIVQFLSVMFVTASVTADPKFYFPPEGPDWETTRPAEAGWNAEKLQLALDYAGRNQSTGVVILWKGRILAEQYWKLSGKNSAKFNQRLVGRDASGHGIEDIASCQKSIASVLIGIAQEKRLLNLDDPVNKHISPGWSRATRAQEDAITIRHLLTMTSGLSSRLQYVTQPGKRWAYNTAAYARTMDIVESVSRMKRNEVTREWLTAAIGMSDSRWVPRGQLGVQAGNAFGFATTAKDLARFGLLMLANGKWNEKQVFQDQKYSLAATTSSQRLNPHYGYLWWVSRNRFDATASVRPATGPTEMYAAKGALNRRCFVVPARQLVVTRLGDQPADGKSFDVRFWKLLMDAAPKQ